jgi:hypothetical protein
MISYLPVEDDGAVARLRPPADGHHQCGLAGAVRADQGDDLAFVHLDIDAAQGLDPAVERRHSVDLEQGFPCGLLLST